MHETERQKSLIVIGSRGSQLALWQSRWVAARLAELGHESRIEIIKTTGDKVLDVSLSKVGGKGLFTKEIEDALLAVTVDIAVHSLKDMPTEQPEGLLIAATPVREDVRDALVGKCLSALAEGDRIGTSSLRRSAQIRALKPGLEVLDIRGNLDTRLRKLDEGQYDAILLAAAGLTRLGWQDRIAEHLSSDVMCPAAGQGALAIETREDNKLARDVLAKLDDPATRHAVTAERAFLNALGGGCQVPIGAHAVIDGDRLHLRGMVASPDGATVLRGSRTGAATDAAGIGRALGEELLRKGAEQILADVART
ncbi:MAG: hydroxymethylbilane synthase [Bryobacteraceae bacterium]